MTDHACIHPELPAASAIEGRRALTIAGVARWLRQLGALGRERRALASLDAHLLADIGLTEEAARTEAARPVWDAPSHWRS